MKRNGRKSAANLSVITFRVPEISPPAELTERQAGAFRAIVATRPPDYFGDEHVPLVANLARAMTTADKLADLIESEHVDALVAREGTQGLARLLAMRERECRLVLAFCRSLRLTHQSKYSAEAASRVPSRRLPRPWEDHTTESK